MKLSEVLAGHCERSQMTLLESHLRIGSISFSHLLRDVYPERLQGVKVVLHETG
jgi:hypothetical protein